MPDCPPLGYLPRFHDRAPYFNPQVGELCLKWWLPHPSLLPPRGWEWEQVGSSVSHAFSDR